ncbi:hypothetical protein SISSUDRAFT_1049810 [Sistotremastrum suecicum HHB10207 ss-3]|uniref:Uncharacterized protein n=1 Tax=Sistotremastrum suecicum HHB10207 ss-3 TaxID=1314776 RepID=A0A166BKC8_9AGAM|nr:hypothetical protein SISSUDRAFT_1049810 [Sistotremastrum suecicum HHB10207 ss-3]
MPTMMILVILFNLNLRIVNATRSLQEIDADFEDFPSRAVDDAGGGVGSCTADDGSGGMDSCEAF